MSMLCPLCNGLDSLQGACRNCGSPTEDRGKYNDFLGPYAPYRDIDEEKLTNGFMDLASGRCIHVFYCSQCGTTTNAAIQEWIM
ncbi:hypothetical protein [Paenibacillus gansuensis]|uniref:Uncharacterized protein n=1 Tax=Paenibacillus gansuensis TaxID=306542 RepID=A0ABW5PGV6_9BACL